MAVTDVFNGSLGSDGGLRGAVHIVFQNADGTVKKAVKIASGLNGGPVLGANDEFGTGLTSPGDLDGDGVVDLAALTARDYTEEGEVESFPSVIHILKMNRDGTLNRAVKITDGDNGGPSFQSSAAIWDLTSVGDIDADGVNDLAITVGNGVHPSESAILLLTLNPYLTVKNVSNENKNISLSHPSFLTSLTFLGDTNGDGRVELAWGLPLEGGLASPRGIVQMLTLENATPNTAVPSVPSLGQDQVSQYQRPGISWGSVPTATQYEVWIRNVDTGVVLVNSEIVGIPFFVAKVDFAAGKYLVHVRAKNEMGKSAWSSPFIVTVSRNVVTNSVPIGASRRPALTWNDLPDAVRYEVWVNAAATPARALIRATTADASTRFTVSRDLPAGTYNFQVRGITAEGRFEPWSLPREFSIVTKIEGVSVTGEFTRTPTIAWEPLRGATTSDIWINDLGRPSNPPIHITTPLYYAYSTLPAMKSSQYRVWVRGRFADGSLGDWSSPTDFFAATAPTFLTAAQDAMVNQSLQVQWQKFDAADHYELWIDDPAPGLSSADSILKVAENKFLMDSFRVQGKYRYWVRIVTLDGAKSDWSKALEITARNQVKNVTFHSKDVLRPVFRWDAMPDAVKYDIEISGIRSPVGNVKVFRPTEDVPIGNNPVRVRGISADGTAGNWSDEVAYHSAAAAVLQPVVSTLEPAITFRWVNGDSESVHYIDVVNITTHRTVLSEYPAVGVTSLIQDLPDGTYKWEMYSFNQNMWSITSIFVIDRRIELTTAFNFPTDQTITLTWTSIAGAVQYDIWISTDRGILVYRNQAVQGLQFTVPFLFPVGKYRTWVRAVSASGYAGAWSTPRDLTVDPVS